MNDLINTTERIWIRPSEVERQFGIKRSKLYELIAKNRVKSVSLREEGQTRGTRLVCFQSVSDYIESHLVQESLVGEETDLEK